MGDADDAVAVAVAATKRVAASRLIRKEELDAELAKLKADRARVAAEAPGPEGDELRQELDGRIAAASGELATVAAEYQTALAEIADLKKLAWKAKAPPVPGATSDDPLVRSPEEIALDNARAHLRDLEAQARVGDELRGTPAAPPTTTTTATAPTTPAPAPAPPSREDADAQALAAFKELRDKHGKPAGGGMPPAPPKKTI
jgi:hypothetical protein